MGIWIPVDSIQLAHGSGGQLSQQLIRDLFLERFSNPILDELEDAAVIQWPHHMSESHPTFGASPRGQGAEALAGSRLAFTTDSYVVTPPMFPGGDIGKLAVCGTVNDLAMRGAQPLHMSVGFILEEGLPLRDLEQIVESMARAVVEVGAQIVTGDTKVVNRGSADRIFINTSGIGLIPPGVDISAAKVQEGDRVLVSGTLGDHGMAIMIQREGLTFESELTSDCAPLSGLVMELLEAAPHLHCMRDPTRGGLTTALNEIAERARVGIEIEGSAVPVRDEVRAACELLGLDPLYVANEGKLVAFVPAGEADAALAALRDHPLGRQAAIIGRTTQAHPGRVVLRTPLGSRRILGMLVGEQLPRIC
jgi:hydrogenase expression/formation protein HypE